MPMDPLTPLRFTPIFKTAMWGGAALRSMFGAPASPDPTGEAWVLSDHGDSLSVVADGPLAGRTLRSLLEEIPEQLLGQKPAPGTRFPLLLKFVHAREPLSVQVHPTDAKARELEGPGAVGKTEAWVVVMADPAARVYAGLEPGVSPDRLRAAIRRGEVERLLYAHAPGVGDCFFLKAGTIHAVGGGLVLFEIQQTSDITYRLYDWGRTDPKTGKPRELHVDKGLACVDYGAGPCRPVHPTDELRGRVRLYPLVECPQFTLSRWDANLPFRAGAPGQCRVLVGTGGAATLRHAGAIYPIGLGSVWLLPAEVGECEVIPHGTVTVLECGLPE
ncbi:MAG TPA: type I phosphomannose isomerase catalytic subunit [Gemmataceae bacterium]|nr:type I phosphomannose isomerase catalytic subunit [Gemmataceae bacterium]